LWGAYRESLAYERQNFDALAGSVTDGASGSVVSRIIRFGVRESELLVISARERVSGAIAIVHVTHSELRALKEFLMGELIEVIELRILAK
jgi:hypothetical protein